MEKLIISVATTGSRTTRQQTPHVPITPDEIAAEAIRCYAAGAAVVHIHVRDDAGRVSCDPARYARVRQLVEEAGCPIIVNMSTGGGAGIVSDEERMRPVELRPEIASFDAGSTNFGEGVFVNSPQFLQSLAERMQANGVKPEIECFDSGMLENAKRFIARGLITPPYWFQFVLGVRGAAPASAQELVHLVGQLPPHSHWSVCAIGRDQLPLNALAIAMGGHARTGLEDNIYYAYRQLAESNAQLVARVARLARELQREIATPDEARAILGLSPRPSPA